VAAAYVAAASDLAATHGNVGGSCHSKPFQTFDVYEFSRRDACGAGTDALHAAQAASFEHAREHAARAKQLGIIFRHATVDDYKTVAHDFYRFYKESYNEEMPESLQSAKAQELRTAILEGEYFIMLAPASWLADATGIATKLDKAESIARDRRARTGSELPVPEDQRMVPVAMASVRGRHPLGARIAEVYVKEDYRKKGFGVLLFHMLVDLVIGTEKLSSLCIFGAAGTEALPNLMRKAGFTKKESLQMVDIIADSGSRICHPGHATKCVIQ
jgi:GNAT superfamily N-acetyltransferase